MTQSDTLINVARFCFGLNMFTTLPLELFVCREVGNFSTYSTWWSEAGCPGHRTILFLPRRLQPSAPFILHQYHPLRVDASYVISLVIPARESAFTSDLVSLITCDLGVTLEITGGVSATALAFIFPAACYLKLSDPRVPLYSRSKLPAVVCLVFGVLVMVVSLFLALGKAWTPEGEARICA